MVLEEVVAGGVGAARDVDPGGTLAVEEDVLAREGAAGVALGQRVGAGAVPVERPGGLGDAFAVAVVVVGDAGGGFLLPTFAKAAKDGAPSGFSLHGDFVQ